MRPPRRTARHDSSTAAPSARFQGGPRNSAATPLSAVVPGSAPVIVWRYLVDPTRSIVTNRSVAVWRVDVVYLTRGDWKYEGSTAGSGGGGRTHTFGVVKPARALKDKAVHARADIKLSGGKPVPA